MPSIMHMFTGFLVVGLNVSRTLLCHIDCTTGSNWTFHVTYKYYLLWTVNLLAIYSVICFILFTSYNFTYSDCIFHLYF